MLGGASREMVWWVVGVRKGSNKRREKRRGRGSTIPHSLTHVPLAACVYRCGMQVDMAGGGGGEERE